MTEGPPNNPRRMSYTIRADHHAMHHAVQHAVNDASQNELQHETFGALWRAAQAICCGPVSRGRCNCRR
jgi:LmbE family N-acetylglucosaminyl deacetylase